MVKLLPVPVGEKEAAKSGMLAMPRGGRVGNKLKRTELWQRVKAARRAVKRTQKKEQEREREALGDRAPPKPVPHTLDSLREVDETIAAPDDVEVAQQLELDEFASYFQGDQQPKIAITTCRNPSDRMFRFIQELLYLFPNSSFFARRNFEIKKIVQEGIEKGYTDLIVLNEDKKRLNGMLVTHLPGGPTAHFKLSNVTLSGEIPHAAAVSKHRPEVILNNFNTRLGIRLGRMFASLFHSQPEFRGRRVATLHNQRDFVFFRQHRYEFRDGKQVGLQEIGPSFTLKLRSLQHGCFDSKLGEYEWIHTPDLDTSRRRFFL